MKRTEWPNVELLTFADAGELVRAAADAWLDAIAAAGRSGQAYCTALSGGRVAAKFFAVTAAQAVTRGVAMDPVHFFWADERCVPPTDPESNFKLAEEILFRPLKIQPEKIHRIKGENNPKAAAKTAEEELKRVVGCGQNQQPGLDLVVLGMGEDGHVASLFPHAIVNNMDISDSFLGIEDSPKPPPVRVSLSYQAIFAAKNVWVLVSGAGKLEALRNSLSGKKATPLGQIIAQRKVKIFSDMSEF